MSFQNKLKKTLNQLPDRFPKGAELLKHFSEQLQGYEAQLKELVGEFDSKSREARDKSQAKLDNVLDQVKKSRSEIEKRVAKLVDTERKRLNANLSDFVTFLKSVSKKEKAPARKKATVKKAAAKKKKTPVKRTASAKATPAPAYA